VTKRVLRLLVQKFLWHSGLGNIHDLLLNQHLTSRSESTINPLLTPIMSSFSQSDEDGIIERITSRLGLKEGRFVEFGVGNGTENNTLNLLMSGWKGSWFGGEQIEVSKGYTFPEALDFSKIWIDLISLEELVIPKIKAEGQIDLLSMDLDGNDYYFTQKLLKNGIFPKIWIQEYNGNFLPSVDWIQPYDSSHIWKQNAFFGASLKSFKKLFDDYGYRLIACNLSGINAFFVKEEYAKSFEDVPSEFLDLFQPALPIFPKMKQARTTSLFLRKVTS